MIHENTLILVIASIICIYPCISSINVEKKEILALNCCESYLEKDMENLWSCVNKTKTVSENKHSIGLVTYSTSSIMDYATYSLSILTIYSQINDYFYYHTAPESGHEYYSNDQRWNKVKIVHNAFTTWGKDLDYIVYLDSDLTILNMNFKFEDIINNNQNFDLIFSKDSHPMNGIMNSGLFIAKNSKWTLDFLEEWWGTTELREMAIDQHAFSMLWNKNSHNMQSHVKLLPPNILNTHFPAWLHQQPQDNILHLAGCSSIFRKAVFKLGLQNLCNGLTDKKAVDQNHNNVLPQLGLNLDTLKELEQQQPLNKSATELRDRLQLTLNEYGHEDDEKDDNRVTYSQYDSSMHGDSHILGDTTTTKVISKQQIQSFRDQLRNLFQRGQGASDNDEDHESNPLLLQCLKLVYRMARLHLQQQREQLRTQRTEQRQHSDVPDGLATSLHTIDSLEIVSSSAFELSLRLESWDLLAHLLELQPEIESLLAMTELHLPEKYPRVLYYSFKFYEFQAGAYSSISNSKGFETALQKGLSVWKKMHYHRFYGYGRGVDYADPYAEGVRIMKELASYKCSHGRFKTAWKLFQDALEFRFQNWSPNSSMDHYNNIVKGDMKDVIDGEGEAAILPDRYTPEEVKQEIKEILFGMADCAKIAGASEEHYTNLVKAYMRQYNLD